MFAGVGNLKDKRILRFYFSAENLDAALDSLILKEGLRSVGAPCCDCADKMIALISAKMQLAELWSYLDGVMRALPEGDVAVLRTAALSRRGRKEYPESERREVKRATVKFFRRARRLACFESALRLVNSYDPLFSFRA